MLLFKVIIISFLLNLGMFRRWFLRYFKDIVLEVIINNLKKMINW